MSSPRCLGICEKMKYSKVYIIADTSRREVAHGARLILQLVGVWDGRGVRRGSVGNELIQFSPRCRVAPFILTNASIRP